MSIEAPQDAAAPWVSLTTTQDDWDEADPDLLRTMYSMQVLVRAFEEFVLDCFSKGLVNGPAHSSIGQEGGAVGSVMALSAGDTVNGSHRGHHQFLAKILQHWQPDGIDPAKDFSPAVRETLLRTLAEVCGLDRGFSHGRGGSMHLMCKEAGALGTNAIVGGGVPMAAGSAWAHANAGTDRVAVTYMGDGAVNIGSTLETFNLAAAWRLPLCFFIENNRYAVSTSVAEATGEPRLAARGPGFGIASWTVDGMDPLAVYLATSRAVEHMRRGEGPALVEADVYRYLHQNGPHPGSAFGYRSKDEEQEWRSRDSVALTSSHLIRRGLLTDADAQETKRRADALMRELGEELFESEPERPGSFRVRPSEWPDVSTVDAGIRGDLSEFAGARYAEEASYTGATRRGRFVEAISSVLGRRMETDNGLVLMGEDIHKLRGGPRGATRGLPERFPGRVLGTPISENAFCGLAGGVALDGRFRPVVELMYADFMWVAADQLLNQIGKVRHMFGGTQDVPLVLRSQVAVGTGFGSQHSMDPAGIMATSPGWRIVAPSTPFDYVGLMNSALRCVDPVLVIEHAALYESEGEIPSDDLDFYIPVGAAAVRRTGRDVTVLTYLAMTGYVLEAAEEIDGVDAEVIDLRWLDRASIDWDTIEQSVRKTNNVLIAEQGAIGTSYGSWLADEIHRRYFDWLDRPVERLTGAESSPTISRVLERAAYPMGPEAKAKLSQFGARDNA
jgi:2-oxoisovalerate dehydrogenase E1 component